MHRKHLSQWSATDSDEVQDTTPQNVIPRHTEYFKLKEYEKWQVKEGLSDFPWGRSQNPHMRGASLRKEHPYLQKRRDTKRTTPLFVVLSHFPTTLLSSSNLAWKHSGLTASSGLISLWNLQCPVKPTLNKLVCLSLANLLGQGPKSRT